MPIPNSRGTVEKLLATLENWLQLSKTDPSLWKVLLLKLSKWKSTDTQHTTEKDNQKGLSHLKDKLGWTLVLEGVITTQWRKQQVTFWKRIKSKQSAKWWAA